MNTTAFASRARTLSINELKELIEKGKIAAAELEKRGVTTAQVPAAPHNSNNNPTKLTAEKVQDAKDRARLDGLLLSYEDRLDALVLPLAGFTTKADSNAADRLASTLHNIQKLQQKLGLPITPTPEQVTKGQVMASDFRRHHDKKTGEPIPRRPRGRPRGKNCTGATR